MNYAPAKFAEEQEAKTAKVSKAALKAAMNRLLDAGRSQNRVARPQRPLVASAGALARSPTMTLSFVAHRGPIDVPPIPHTPYSDGTVPPSGRTAHGGFAAGVPVPVCHPPPQASVSTR